MFTVGEAMYSPTGAYPPQPPTDAYLRQIGVAEVVFSRGAGNLKLPQAFPTGWLSLQITSAYYSPPGTPRRPSPSRPSTSCTART